MHFTTDELRSIASALAAFPKADTTLMARVHLAIAKQTVAALTKKPVKPTKEVK